MNFGLRTLLMAMGLLAATFWMAFHGPAPQRPLNLLDGLARSAVYFVMFSAVALYVRREVAAVRAELRKP